MENNHKLGLMLATFAMMATSENRQKTTRNEDILNSKPDPKPKWLTAKQNGLKEWNINDKIVYAATKKKAIKLATKI